MTATKTTSLQKMTEALAEAEWEYAVTETQVKVPDYDNAVRNNWSQRASYVPIKMVPGVRIEARNNAGNNAKAFTVEFTETGKFLAENTRGGYPFTAKKPLKDLLAEVEKHGPTAIARRAEIRAQEAAAQEAKEEREVAEAYAAAREDLRQANLALGTSLTQAGLDEEQVKAVVSLIGMADEGPEVSTVSRFLAAKTQVQRTGKGWVPGRTYVRGTYVNGKKVGS